MPWRSAAKPRVPQAIIDPSLQPDSCSVTARAEESTRKPPPTRALSVRFDARRLALGRQGLRGHFPGKAVEAKASQSSGAKRERERERAESGLEMKGGLQLSPTQPIHGPSAPEPVELLRSVPADEVRCASESVWGAPERSLGGRLGYGLVGWSPRMVGGHVWADGRTRALPLARAQAPVRPASVPGPMLGRRSPPPPPFIRAMERLNGPPCPRQTGGVFRTLSRAGAPEKANKSPRDLGKLCKARVPHRQHQQLPPP